MRRLDPLTTPLTGLNLIEASAGTGKTYTIATLYLRLLLGHLDATPLDVDRILVVTFTKAATEELRGRIRARVRQALSWLEQGIDGEQEHADPVLAELLRDLPDPEAARGLLADALTRIDEAAVFTIHGFAQRMLQENAFESGAPFDAELITDEQQLRATVMADFWRRETAGMSEEEAVWLLSNWKTPAELLAVLEPALSRPGLRLVPELDAEAVARELEALTPRVEEIRRVWRERREEVVGLLADNPALNKGSYARARVEFLAAEMDWFADQSHLPAAAPKGFERLTPPKLAGRTKKGKSTPAHPFFDLCGGLDTDALARANDERRALILTRAHDYLLAELVRRKEERRVMYFDDLLRGLVDALEGTGGPGLAQVIRDRYPRALIDEFQDTDPWQYRIFRTVYEGRPGCGLFLIGDPKQAIYGFRGADIHTYMEAARHADALGQSFTLGTNYRSSSGLVRAVNRLFEQAHRPFVFDRIRFEPVDWNDRADAEPLLLDGAPPTPLQLWWMPVTPENESRRPRGFLAGELAQPEAALACAERIAGLLNLVGEGRALVGKRSLRPGDIAVLVRTHREGDLVRAALSECAVPSVSLSQDSVLATSEAQELLVVLEAMAQPGDEGRVRAALATRLCDGSLSRLAGLAADELEWDRVLGRFQGYRERWLGEGFIAAFQDLLLLERIPEHLLARPGGDRRMTNLRQLAELLQAAGREQAGPDALLRWLADQQAEAAEGVSSEERQLRLESDGELVQIVTLHKSKGLEYPLVFIPFPWSHWKGSAPGKPKPPPFFHDPVDQRPCLDLGSPDLEHHRALAEEESLAERLRLFYVGVTRARHLCVVCWGRVNNAERSAPAYLLHPERSGQEPRSRMKELTEAQMRAELGAIAAGSGGVIEVATLPEAQGIRWTGRDQQGRMLAAAQQKRPIDRSWRVVSYSGLLRREDEARPDYDQGSATAPAPSTEPVAEPDPLFLFPRGIQAGHCLHALFEILDFPTAEGATLEQAAARSLDRYGLDRIWLPAAMRMVGNTLDTALDAAADLCLRAIGAPDRLTELEFHYRLDHLEAAGLRIALEPFADYRAAVEHLDFEAVGGLMKGYIDLTFRHRGRYFIADYKSNHLGDRLEDYGEAGLASAMGEHRYDLQYLVYTLALHRYLGQRLPGYDYGRHFGGVYYLFLRGMRPAEGPTYGVYHDRPPFELVQALDDCLGGGGARP